MGYFSQKNIETGKYKYSFNKRLTLNNSLYRRANGSFGSIEPRKNIKLNKGKTINNRKYSKAIAIGPNRFKLIERKGINPKLLSVPHAYSESYKHKYTQKIPQEALIYGPPKPIKYKRNYKAYNEFFRMSPITYNWGAFIKWILSCIIFICIIACNTGSLDTLLHEEVAKVSIENETLNWGNLEIEEIKYSTTNYTKKGNVYIEKNCTDETTPIFKRFQLIAASFSRFGESKNWLISLDSTEGKVEKTLDIIVNFLLLPINLVGNILTLGINIMNGALGLETTLVYTNINPVNAIANNSQNLWPIIPKFIQNWFN